MVLELQRHGRQRAEDLAATFETSKRTIYRDIQALCESGVPVVGEAGIGYSLIEGYFLPPLSFTTDEATMLLLGSKFVAEQFDAHYRDAARGAAAKIEGVLSKKVRDEVASLRETIRLVPAATLSRDTSSGMLPALRRAIIEGRTVSFDYHTRYTKTGEQPRNTRAADPYGLIHAADAWYLIGHCHMRKDIRNFKIDRMDQIQVLDQRFERPVGFKLEQDEEEGRNVIIRALFSPQVAPWVRESRSYYVTEMEDTIDGLLVTMRAHTEAEVFNWLLGWGANVRILDPESLRRRIAEEAGRILENNF